MSELPVVTVESQVANAQAGIRYTREHEISVDGFNIPLANIHALEYEPINPFQRLIVVILQHGCHANDKLELTTNLSNSLNLKRSFVEDYINRINHFLEFDVSHGAFKLSDNVIVAQDKDNLKLWKIQTKEVVKDYWRLLYFPEMSLWLDQKEIDTYYFSEGETQPASKTDTQRLANLVQTVQPIVESIVSRDFKNEYSIKQPMSYICDQNKPITKTRYTIPLRVTYSFQNGISEMVDITHPPVIAEENWSSVIAKAKTKFTKDDVIPNFIRYRDDLQKASDDFERIEETYSLVEETKEKQKRADNELRAAKKAKQKAEADLVKANVKYSKAKAAQATVIADEIVKLETVRNGAEDTIQNRQQEIESFTAAINGFNEVINANKEAKKWQKDVIKHPDTKDEYSLILDSVFEKYNDQTSTLHQRIQFMCSNISMALDALDHDSFDQMVLYIGVVRDFCRQTTKAVLDCLCGEEKRSIAAYYHDAFIRAKITSVVAGLGPIELDRMNTLDQVQNAIGHVADNTELKQKNDASMQTFKELTKAEQKDIIISIIKFYQRLKIDSSQKKAIEKSLRLGK